MYKDETFTRCISISHKSYPKISAQSVWRKKRSIFQNVSICYYTIEKEMIMNCLLELTR